MNTQGRIRVDFDALLFVSRQGGWVNFISGNSRSCQVQLIESERGSHVLCCKQDGQVVYQTNTTTLSVKQMDEGFLQVTNNGMDRITLGMKFRNNMDARNFMGLLQPHTVTGPTSMPTGRPAPFSHHSEFSTFAGGNYRGAPNGPNSYPQEQYGRRQDHYTGVGDGYPSGYGQQPVRGGAQQPVPPTSNGGMQEVPRSAAVVDQEPKPAIKSEEELKSYAQHLEAALYEGDVDYAKVVVKKLVEAKKNQRNFGVIFPHGKGKQFFKLRVTIEREMFLEEGPVPCYLFVTENDSIKKLQEMIELKYSISCDQQHWIIGQNFVTDKEATLKSFGIKSKGAEVYLFISKGGVGKDAPSIDDTSLQYQQSGQYQGQQYNQSAPGQQYQQHQGQGYDQRSSRQYSRSNPAPVHHRQSQYGRPNQQPYQQQQYNRQQDQPNYQVYSPSHAPQNQGYNQSLPPPEPTTQHCSDTGPRVLPESVGTRGQQLNPQDQPLSIMPEGIVQQPPEPVHTPTPPPVGWPCPVCTMINKPHRPACEMCLTDRPDDYQPPPDYQATEEELKWKQDDQKGKQDFEEYERKQRELREKQAKENYEAMMAMANQNLVPNDVEFDCPICFVPIEVGEGVKLRECLHHCCKECLRDHILAFRDADVLCPCNEEFDCKGTVTELEMRALLTDEELAKVHNKGLDLVERQERSFHCKTPDCNGWCIYEDEVNDFDCPVCIKRNCLLCKAIHYPEMNCKEYQEDIKIKAANDEAAKATQKMLEDMIKIGEAMYCPNQNCGLIVQKKDGCSWIQCSCKTEICWVTKKPRRGPNGCGCNYYFGGKKCHPQCQNCH